MMTPEDLDELLQVNSSGTWLMLAGIGVILAGMLAWGFLGSVTQHVKGFGIIKIRELPREVVSVCSGQIDSIFCETGDEVAKGQKLLQIFELHEKAIVTIFSSYPGEITGLNVKEGSYVETGAPVLEMMRSESRSEAPPEVIFFVEEQQVSKLKKGMITNLEIDKGGVPPEFLTAVINFIADYPVSKNSIQKYFPDEEITKQLSDRDFHEVRASLIIDAARKTARAKEALHSLNGLSCRTVTTVARRSPVAYLLN